MYRINVAEYRYFSAILPETRLHVQTSFWSFSSTHAKPMEECRPDDFPYAIFGKAAEWKGQATVAQQLH